MADESKREQEPDPDRGEYLDEESLHLNPDAAPDASGKAPTGLDGAIRTAFAEALNHDAASVLQRIGSRGGGTGGVHLTSPDSEQGPVLRPTADEGRTHDRYRVLGEVARGGVGTVLQVRDTDLGRDVAVKVLHDRYATNPDVIQRFIEEAQIGGQLQHPGVVPVYELGVQKDGRPFFAMKLVKGQTLSSILSRRSSPSQDRAAMMQIFQRICQTVAYAHARKVIHRDLKPSNVMVGAFGEVQVVDWGFAKVLGQGGVADERTSRREVKDLSVIETVRSGSSGSGSESMVGAVLGTPAYMSPEQALGDIDRLDERTDVFALGAILCEILTGRPPYERGEEKILVQAARARLDEVFERLDGCGADPRVVGIAKDCLAPMRRNRPRDGGEVERAVTTYLNSREEQARKAEIKASAAEAKAEVETRARKRVLVFAGTAVGALLIGAVGLIMAGSASAERTQQTARLVDADLQDADRLARVASAQNGAAENAWDAAIAQAAEAVALAEREEADEVTLERARGRLAMLQEDAQAATRRAERSSADRALRRELREYAVRARLPADYDARAEGDKLVLALAEWGLRLRMDTPKQAVEALGGSLLRNDVVAAMNLYRLGLAPDERANVDAILAAIDPDPWRLELRALGTDPAALKERAKAWKASSRAAADAVLLSDALVRADAIEEAAGILRGARVMHPADPVLALAQASTAGLGAKPDWPAVSAAVNDVRETGDLPFGLKCLEVRALLHSKEVERGLGLARALRAEAPEAKSAGEILAEALDAHAQERNKAKDVKGAAAAWRESLTLDPAKDERRAQFVQALVATNVYEEAMAEAKAHVERKPGDAERHQLLARVLWRRVGREGKSGFGRPLVDAGRAALVGCPEDKKGGRQVFLVRYLAIAGNNEEAEELGRQVLAGATGALRVRALEALGAVQFAKGKFTDAAATMREALTLDSEDFEDSLGKLAIVNAGIKLARILRTMGKEEEALALIDRAVAGMNSLASNHRLAANEYLTLHKVEKALVQIEKALALEPDNAAAHEIRARALMTDDRMDEALEEIDVASRSGAESAPYLRILALMGSGQVDAALEALDSGGLTNSQLEGVQHEAVRRHLDRVKHRVLSRLLTRDRHAWRRRIALGELLATSEDPRVADAELALEILEEVPEEANRPYGWHWDLRENQYDALVRLGRAEEALAKFEDTLRWHRALRGGGEFWMPGLMRLRQGAFEAARKGMEAGLEQILQVKEQALSHPIGVNRVANLRRVLGTVLMHLGQFERAEPMLARAAELVDGHGLAKGQKTASLARQALARLALLRGDLDAAEDHAKESSSHGRRSRLTSRKVVPRIVVARAAMMRGALDSAQETAADVLEGLRALGKACDPWEEAEANLVLGMILALQKQATDAKTHLAAAEEIGRRIDHAGTIVGAVCRLAALPGGDPASAAKTLAEFESRVPIHERIEAHALLFEAGAGETHRAAAKAALTGLLELQGENARPALLRDVARYKEIDGWK